MSLIYWPLFASRPADQLPQSCSSCELASDGKLPSRSREQLLSSRLRCVSRGVVLLPYGTSSSLLSDFPGPHVRAVAVSPTFVLDAGGVLTLDNLPAHTTSQALLVSHAVQQP
jgi:hypothetical protein